MRTTVYIHQWDFDGGYVLSDDSKIYAACQPVPRVTLKPQRRAVKLPGQGLYYYATDEDIFVRTAPFTPSVKRSWDFIEVVGITPNDDNLNSPTSIDLRIHDGANSLYWDGGAWSAAGATDWNTETEVNANLSSFTGDSLAIEARLSTTDNRFAPVLSSIKLRWTGDVVSMLRNAIYQGVVATMIAGLRPLSDATLPGNGTTSVAFGTATLGEAALDANFKVDDVIAVYDHTADPDHGANLLASWAADTITLTSAVASTNTLWVVFAYEPTVAVTTSSDFVIGAELPAIWLTEINAGPKKMLGGSGPHVLDRTQPVPAGTVYPTPIPFRDLSFEFAILAPTSVDLIRLGEAFEGWFTAHPKIRVPALDYEVALRPGILPTWDTTTTDEDDTRLVTGTFLLKNVPTFGDQSASAADGGNTTIGPINAGDANHPGVGYGIASFNVTFRTEEGGDEQLTVTE